MQISYLLVGLALLLAGCKDDNGVQVQSFDAPVQSFANLPIDYQPILQGSSVAGRLKSETYAGQLTSEWRYNQQGKIVEWRNYKAGQVTTADQYRYDATGRLRYVQHFDNECGYSSLSSCSGTVKWTSYNEFDTDDAGRIQESRTFLKQSEQWELRSVATYEYNSQQLPVKVLMYDSTRKLGKTQEFTYEGIGNIISLREISTNTTPEYADRTFRYEYAQGLNPYAGTVHYISAFFSSRHVQLTPGTNYEYAANGYPLRIHQNNLVSELAYY